MTDPSKFKKIAVHGVPRSGTSWVGEILNSSPNTVYRYQPLFSYAHKNYLNNISTKENIDQFFRRLRNCNDDFTNQETRRTSGDFPQFRKGQITHVIYKEVRYMNILFNLMKKAEDVLLLSIIRNPLSVINSWLRAPREFRRDLGWSEKEEWRYAPKKNRNCPEEFNGYEKWKEAANTFLKLQKAYPHRVYILKYSDLLMQPAGETKKIFNFLGLEFTEQTKRFLQDSTTCKRGDAYAVFRNNPSDDKWKTELNPGIVKEIQADLEGTVLEIFI